MDSEKKCGTSKKCAWQEWMSGFVVFEEGGGTIWVLGLGDPAFDMPVVSCHNCKKHLWGMSISDLAYIRFKLEELELKLDSYHFHFHFRHYLIAKRLNLPLFSIQPSHHSQISFPTPSIPNVYTDGLKLGDEVGTVANSPPSIYVALCL